MAGGLWWVPSLLVFGAAFVVAIVIVVAARRAGARRLRIEADRLSSRERDAKALLVRTDNALREAADEAAFAEAQFGRVEAAEYRRTLEQAAAWLREAFLLQQRLDDAEPDTPEERRSWTERITGLCDSALAALERTGRRVDALRAAERGVAAEAPVLRDELDRLRARTTSAQEDLDRLVGRFAPAALAGFRDAVARAAALLAEADAALAESTHRAGDGLPAAGAFERAAAKLARAGRELEVAERAEIELAQAQADARITAAELAGELEQARRERQRLELAEPAAALDAAIEEASLGLASRGDAVADPVADGERLQSVRARLEGARHAARAAQGRLDGARSALDGALRIARGQIAVADHAIARSRGRIGAEARTRLAEAERQLAIARDEADPVAALDAARRATSRANDAEALARYDALG